MPIALKKVFKNNILQASFEKNGFAKLPRLGDTTLETLQDIFEQHRETHEHINATLVSTSHSNSRELIETVDAQIVAAITPYFEQHLFDYSIIFSNLLLKKCGPATATPPHQDASFVDERRDMVFNVWIPLANTNPGNGCLRFLPASHLLPLNPRPAPTHPWPYEKVKEIIELKMIDLPMKAGEPVAFHGASIHASYPNMTDAIRPSVVIAVSNAGAWWIQYYCKDYNTGLVEEYPMTKESYLSYVKETVPTDKAPLRQFVLRPPSLKRFYFKYAPLRLLLLPLP